jgi:hypothetical protein
MSKALKALGIIAAAGAIGLGLTGCDSGAASYSDLTAAQQAKVDKACHSGTDYPSKFPTEYAHCVQVMVKQAAK